MADNIIDWADKINSPELEAFLDQFGEEYYLSAEEINQIRDAINLINRKTVSPDGLISLGAITRNGNDFLFTAGVAVWRYLGIEITNYLEFTATITTANAGKYRTDVVGGNQAGELLRFVGEESNEVTTAFELPAGWTSIKQFNVFGAIIEDVAPIIGNVFVKKESLGDTIISLTTGDVILPNVGKFNYIIQNTSNLTIVGVSNSFLGTMDGNELVVGQVIKTSNVSTLPQTLKHNLVGPNYYPFLHPSGVDFIQAHNTIAVWRFTGNAFQFESYSNIAAEILALSKTYADTKSAEALTASRTTPQFNITGNTTLTNAHNGSILKIKATCTITVPTALIGNFSCVARTFAGATATWVEGSGLNFDAPNGKIQDPFRMVTFFKDGNGETGILEGGVHP